MNLFMSLLLSGSTLGLTLGVAPSPVLTLSITQTLSRGFKEGYKVVVAAIVVDIPLLLVTVFLYSKITDLTIFLGIVSLLGGAFIAYLGYKYIVIKGINLDDKASHNDSCKQGILANLLNPNPYIFWFTVGGTIIGDALTKNIFDVVAFLLGFYSLLLLSRFCILYAVSKSTRFIKGMGYLIIIKLLGFIMLLFAVRFIINGLEYFI